MNPVIFDHTSFFYTQAPDTAAPETEALENPQEITQVFDDLSISLPEGVVSVVGQNGIGKSTFLLLAAARLFPAKGSVKIFGKDTSQFANALEDPDLEEERNRYVSFIYQNMEFETSDPVGEIMEYVYDQGYYEEKDPEFLRDIIKELELSEVLTKRTQELSKGQLQRVIIAFSMLYGSKLIGMDEPVFALEDHQKEKALEFLMDFARSRKVNIYYSIHELDLSRKYSDYILLFHKNGDVEIGPTKELFTRENIEKAYQVPYNMLNRKENLYREMLIQRSKALRGSE
ncbi:MAG: ATP-binding cassette domain-containing protein [Spirochaetia bacterium]